MRAARERSNRSRRAWRFGLPLLAVLLAWVALDGRESVRRAEQRGPDVPSERVRETPRRNDEPKDPEPAADEIVGRLVVVDRAGLEHPREDGRFTLLTWIEGEPAALVPVSVSKGEWRAKTAPGRRARVTDLTIGGRVAVVVDEGGLAGSGDREVTLRARWKASCALRVLDDATGRDLSGVEVVRLVSGGREDEPHPHGAGTAHVVKEAVSPVSLPPADRLAVYWVRARGFAWSRIRIDHVRGGERTIRLKRGGALEVTVVGPAARGRFLVLRRAEADEHGVPYTESALPESGVARVNAMEPGRYDVLVTSAEWWRRSHTLGSAEVVVPADAVERVTVRLAEPAPQVTVPVAGVLVVPEAWGAIDVSLSIRTARGTTEELLLTALQGKDGGVSTEVEIDADEMTKDRDGRLHWDAGRIPPGEYVATIGRTAYQVAFRVGATGDASVRLALPRPADVVLRTVDDATGLRVPLREIRWSPAWVSFLDARSSVTARSAPDPGTFRFRAPIGEIHLDTAARGWALASPAKVYSVRPHRNEYDVRVIRLSGLRVRFRDGNAAVPLGADKVTLQSVDGHKDLETSADRGDLLFFVRNPGAYELVFENIPGFQREKPRRVELRQGTTKTVVVALRRKGVD